MGENVPLERRDSVSHADSASEDLDWENNHLEKSLEEYNFKKITKVERIP